MNQNLPQFIVAKLLTAPIVTPVKWNWKWFRTVAFAALLALGAGCSGIHASKSVSPATFLIPGLMMNDTPAAHDSIPAAPPGELVALAN
jgi:hypothetical protein